MIHEKDIPNYRKKSSKKTPQKADHKHDYVFCYVKNETTVYKFVNGVKEKHYWVTIINKCSMCGKGQADFKSMSEKEYADFLNKHN